jgi:50S ribosomal protein L16 3-hydroxylase
MGVLADWLQTVELAAFVREHLGAAPFARPQSARSAIAHCTWQVLDRLLAARPADVLVVADGRSLALLPPRSEAELRELFRKGAGIAIRTPERDCTTLAELSASFARDIPGEQRVIVFATPAGRHGFGWHYDPEDVFIVQTEGDKEYFFRRNTVAPPGNGAFQPDFSAYHAEGSPLMSCRLLPGDWLYLPRGFWHMAWAHADSLSVSIGVLPRRG